MSLPASIQAQLDQADALHAQLVEGANAPAETVTETPTPPVEQVAAPAPQPTAPQPDVWEQRYRALQGKYDAEVPRLHQQLREVNQVVQNLTAQANKRPEPTTPREALVTQKDVETYGGDLVDLIGRKAQEIAGSQVHALQQQIAALESKLGQTAQRQDQSDEGRFYTALAGAVPDYKEINLEPAWLQWLGQVDPLTGRSRQNYLDDAAASRDAGRVATIFSTFKASRTPPAQVTETIQQELSRQVAPSRSSSGTPKAAATPGTKVWTSKDLDAHYRKVRLNEIAPADAARIESEINQAMAEGRMRF